MANSVVRLSIDSHEFDANIKRAGEALNKFFDQAKKGDRTFEVLDDDAMEVVKTFGKMETSSKSARGQLAELTKGFTDLSLIYKRLTDEEKASPAGKEMAKSLGELKTRIQDTKKDLASINQELSGSKFGQFGGIIDGIGHKIGVSANLTELLTSKTALMTAGIGAAVAAIYKGTEAWTKYNAELSKQDQITQVTTGLKGSSADHMTDVMRALSDTYKVDFREAINAANTLMTQFGKSGDEAIQLIKDGMQGMIQGDGGKLLNMIQQFAPAFRDAGISADKLVAIIHNSEGGLFSDQNMNAILMGIKNIRLMTKATSDSLAKLGIDGQEMSRKMSEGSLSVFEALKQVATKLKDCEAGSQEAGQVMQNVFGRQGAMQGMKLARAIAELNTNLEETKKQTGELGDAFAELQTANEKLNTAIRDAFSYDGWEQMTNGIKATLISTLADVIEKLGKIRDFVAPGGITTGRYQNKRVDSEVKDVQSATQGEGDSAKIKQQQILDKYDREIAAKRKELERARTETNDGVGAPYATTIRVSEKTKEDIEKEIKALQKMKEEFRQESNKVITIPSPVTPGPEKTTPDPNKPISIVKSTAKTAKELNPMQQAQKEISALTEEALTADDARLEVIKKEIAALQEQVNVYKSIQDFVQGKEPNWNIQVGDRKAFETEQKQKFEANGGTASRLESMQYSVMKEIKAEDAKVDTETLHSLLKDALQNSIDTTSLDLTTIAEQIGEGINVPDETWQAILDKYNELREQIGEEPIKIDFKTGKIDDVANVSKEIGKNMKFAASMTQTLGSAISSIEDPGAKVAATVAQSIATIAMAYSDALAKDSSSKFNIFSFIAAAAAATVSMATTIASIHSATGYASGGIVKGNSYSGDNIGGLVDGSQFVGLNAGEVVLTRAMTGNLASQLSSQNGRASVSSTPYVTGEKIILGINNYAKKQGWGELVFSRR